MPVDSIATKVKMQQRLFCRTIRPQMRIRVNFTYVTSLLDGVDVMARHYHARQHARGRGVATYPVMRAWDRKPTSCQLFKPALFKAHTGAVPLARRLSKVYSVSHTCYSSAAQDHPVYIKIVQLQYSSC